MDGRVHVCKRENSRLWQCATFLENRNHRVSTGKDSLAEAIDFAEDWYLGLRGKAKAGVLKTEQSFAKAAEVFLEEYEAVTAGERNPEAIVGHRRRIHLHLVPFFGKLGVSEVNSAKALEYRIKRRKELVKGKASGPSRSKSMPGAVHPFERVMKRRAGSEARPESTALVFPDRHRELLNSILAEEGLKFDRDGQRRSAYSLRHTYISLRLMEGADIYQIAKNCRTSVEMIEQHYAAHIKNMLDATAINVRKPRTPRPRKRRASDAPRNEAVAE
jgi:hypothetical protein